MRALGTGVLGVALVLAAIGPCLCPPIASVQSETHRCCDTGGTAMRAASDDCCNAPLAMQTAAAAFDSTFDHDAADSAVVLPVAVNTPRRIVPSSAPLLIALRI
jgi:hypothetical protein